MPELPEVETVCAALRALLLERRVIRIETSGVPLRRPVQLAGLRESCGGRRVAAVRRRGKYIVVEFAGGCGLLLHLGMSGSFRVEGEDLPARSHDHLIFHLDRRQRWVFNDPRRFGLAEPVHIEVPGADPAELAGLGPEPLGPAFDGGYLFDVSRVRNTPVKNLLLDQGVVAGIGNIYASEALFRAGISPRRRAGRLRRAECTALAQAIREVLRDAIACGGTTIRDFHALDGREGEFAVCLRVYGKTGEPCPRCGPTARIRRLTQAGRSTYYCPHCQR
ncbi:MAG: Formamidopyrimidine-DNA glycosylase [Lentisphaerae bacterium ADurb.BinA184]|nr:MAG: Formamidopyrimidine-DNA glycosylase [Lentisphaerae bacterium ADurb.BinA184]